MSVILGIYKPPGSEPSDRELLLHSRRTERYAPDGTFPVISGRIGMAVQLFHTTERSRRERGPAADCQGNLLTLDGRLDNYRDVAKELDLHDLRINDSELALAAFSKWEGGCFSRFIGDWAIALWSAKDRRIYLARDHAGTRSLFFQSHGDELRWSTYLETFVTFGESLDIDRDYAACFLSGLPIRELTPFKGIRSVPPGCYLVVEENKIVTKSHWHWMSEGPIRYASDSEYDEQFFSLFRQSVERRTSSDTRILAQLSGGMDSTSIVCMSDHIRNCPEHISEGLIDTLSFYNESEPTWNEKPFFSITEAARRKVGIHIETSFMDRTFEPPDPSEGLYLFPGADSSTIHKERHFIECLGSSDYRVVISGIGGDEVTGGVPTALPELADHLVSMNLFVLLKSAVRWCLATRTPITALLFNTAGFAVGSYRRPHVDRKKLPPWLSPKVNKLCRELMRRDIECIERAGRLPSAICNVQTWWAIMETMPHLTPPLLKRYEYRYPYLDRDLVSFLFRVPADQLVRPGRRRSLMRRALKNLVPTEILERRRKAFVARGPLVLLDDSKEQIKKLIRSSLAAEFGFINPNQLCIALEQVATRTDLRWTAGILRMVGFELWLRSLCSASLCQDPQPIKFLSSGWRQTSSVAGRPVS